MDVLKTISRVVILWRYALAEACLFTSGIQEFKRLQKHLATEVTTLRHSWKGFPFLPPYLLEPTGAVALDLHCCKDLVQIFEGQTILVSSSRSKRGAPFSHWNLLEHWPGGLAVIAMATER